MKQFDLSLYLVTDSRKKGESGKLEIKSFLEIVEKAIEGGITMVQLREKNTSQQETIEKALLLLNLLTPKKIPLIINDDIEVAKKVGAQGVHLGKKDISPQEARQLLGPDAILGLSIDSLSDLAENGIAACDYLSASPVFPSITKEEGAGPIGLTNLAKLKVHSPLPLIAIGGITERNLSQLFASANVDGIALVSPIMASKDPKASAFRIKQRFQKLQKKEKEKNKKEKS